MGKCEVYCIELCCNINERLRRNLSFERLSEKPSKKNLEWSNKNLLSSMEKHRIFSDEKDRKKIKYHKYVIIDNTNLSPEETAKQIYELLNF